MKPKIAIIVAIAENNAIGINNKMPWHISEDLKYFQKKTVGKPIIMGRKTFESIGCKPLPSRHNIVVSRSAHFQSDNVETAQSLEQALVLARQYIVEKEQSVDEIMIIGGAEIYRQALTLADRIYLTKVYKTFDADSFFPELDLSQWKQTRASKVHIESNPDLKYCFFIFERSPSLCG